MGALDWLFGATPGQQAGQLAEKAIGGVFNGVKELIKEFHLAPEQEAKLNLLVLQHEAHVRQQFIDDVQNARSMQIQTKSVWPGILSGLEIIGFFGVLGFLIFHGFPKDMDEFSKGIIQTMIGAVVVGYAAVRAFWLGSSAGSQSKDQLIYNSTPSKKAGE